MYRNHYTLTGISRKKFPIFTVKFTAVFLSFSMIFTQTIAWADPRPVSSLNLQQPTVFSNWGVSNDESKLLMACLDLYLEKIEKDPRNQNISRMEKALERMLKTLADEASLPENIREKLPHSPMRESDRAVRVELGSGVVIRYYNPGIKGAEKPDLPDGSAAYRVIERDLNKGGHPDYIYLVKQTLIRGPVAGEISPGESVVPSEDTTPWYDREVTSFFDKNFIRANLEAISSNAGSLMPYSFDFSWNGIDTMRRLVKELRQEERAIKKYVDSLDILDALLKEEHPTPSIFLRYMMEFYNSLANVKAGIRVPGQVEEVEKVITRMLNEESREKAKADPVGYAADVFIDVFEAHEFYNYNHRMAAFVMNFVLMKTLGEYFVLTPMNVERYYRVLSPVAGLPKSLDRQRIKSFFIQELAGGKDGIYAYLSAGDSVPWFNRRVYARFSESAMRSDLKSVKEMSEEIADKVFDKGVARRLPVTTDPELKAFMGEHFKSLVRKELNAFSVDNYIKAISVFYRMLEDASLGPEKMKEYMLEFQKSSLGQEKAVWRQGEKDSEKEFMAILDDVFSGEAAAEIKEDIFFYVAVTFVDMVRLQPFNNGNHRLAGSRPILF